MRGMAKKRKTQWPLLILIGAVVAVVGSYWVEGHVPVDLMRRLMVEKPEDIRGIAVPGMPVGSPGMEGPDPVRYDILAYDADGNTTVYDTRQGRGSAEK